MTATRNLLIEAGYDWVGIDHFAKKTDQLSIAKQKGEVYRNFGGETTYIEQSNESSSVVFGPVFGERGRFPCP